MSNQYDTILLVFSLMLVILVYYLLQEAIARTS